MHANEKPEIHFVEMTYTAPYHFTNSGPKVRSFTCYVETSISVFMIMNKRIGQCAQKRFWYINLIKKSALYTCKALELNNVILVDDSNIRGKHVLS